MSFNQLEFMKNVKEDRAQFEALKKRLSRRVAEAREDPNVTNEARGYAEQFIREGASKMNTGIQILEKGFYAAQSY